MGKREFKKPKREKSLKGNLKAKRKIVAKENLTRASIKSLRQRQKEGSKENSLLQIQTKFKQNLKKSNSKKSALLQIQAKHHLNVSLNQT